MSSFREKIKMLTRNQMTHVIEMFTSKDPTSSDYIQKIIDGEIVVPEEEDDMDKFTDYIRSAHSVGADSVYLT